MRFSDGAGKAGRKAFEQRLSQLQAGVSGASGSNIVDVSLNSGSIKPITPRPKAKAKVREELTYDTEAASQQVKRTLGLYYRGTVSRLGEHAEEQAKKQVNLPLREL